MPYNIIYSSSVAGTAVRGRSKTAKEVRDGQRERDEGTGGARARRGRENEWDGSGDKKYGK